MSKYWLVSNARHSEQKKERGRISDASQLPGAALKNDAVSTLNPLLNADLTTTDLPSSLEKVTDVLPSLEEEEVTNPPDVNADVLTSVESEILADDVVGFNDIVSNSVEGDCNLSL